jgi:hypothetical protein
VRRGLIRWWRCATSSERVTRARLLELFAARIAQRLVERFHQVAEQLIVHLLLLLGSLFVGAHKFAGLIFLIEMVLSGFESQQFSSGLNRAFGRCAFIAELLQFPATMQGVGVFSGKLNCRFAEKRKRD